jgi:hypothetical protein
MVSGEMNDHPIIGRQLFDVITSGMYDNPLMIFREYIQNAVDSIDLGIEQGTITLSDAIIEIELNGQDRSITVMDHGIGLSKIDAHHNLRNLGCSSKEGTLQRGFRGIGRLGGLAYCDELVFETRSHSDEMVTVVTWDRIAFEKLTADNGAFVSLLETIERVSHVSSRVAEKCEPPHFFKVTLKNVHRFHSDVLMNVKAVYGYLSQVAPVTYDHQSFQFAGLIESNYSKLLDYRCYKITVNGREIKRPYSDVFNVSSEKADKISDIEFFTFLGFDETPIALGWYARTNFLASLPAFLNCRGIRVRQGNLEIGNEHFLDEAFTERRFSGWQIGEIHILNNKLRPNARRDGFEQSSHYERFLEQAHLLGRHLSGLCRKSSSERTIKVRVEITLQRLEQLFAAPTTYIDEEHYEQALEYARKSLKQIETSANNGAPKVLHERYSSLVKLVEERLRKPVYLDKILDGRRLRKLNKKALLTHVAKTIVTSSSNTSTANELLQKIILPFIARSV